MASSTGKAWDSHHEHVKKIGSSIKYIFIATLILPIHSSNSESCKKNFNEQLLGSVTNQCSLEAIIFQCNVNDTSNKCTPRVGRIMNCLSINSRHIYIIKNNVIVKPTLVLLRVAFTQKAWAVPGHTAGVKGQA